MTGPWLRSFVYVPNDDGDPVWFPKGTAEEEVPAWALPQLGEHLWSAERPVELPTSGPCASCGTEVPPLLPRLRDERQRLICHDCGRLRSRTLAHRLDEAVDAITEAQLAAMEPNEEGEQQ